MDLKCHVAADVILFLIGQDGHKAVLQGFKALKKTAPWKKQAFGVGKSIVGCGKFSSSGEFKNFSSFVHSEKTANTWYQIC